MGDGSSVLSLLSKQENLYLFKDEVIRACVEHKVEWTESEGRDAANKNIFQPQGVTWTLIFII